jgi:hypothetical protein
MINPETVFDDIAESLSANPNIKRGKMFGVPTLWVNGNAFASYFHGTMAFKLSSADVKKALELQDAKLFDPGGNNRPMREWVQLLAVHRDQWADWADAALSYVSTLPPK